jgi:hypothetical protein
MTWPSCVIISVVKSCYMNKHMIAWLKLNHCYKHVEFMDVAFKQVDCEGLYFNLNLRTLAP